MTQTVAQEALIETKQCTATVQAVFTGNLSDLQCLFYIPCIVNTFLQFHLRVSALKIRALVLTPYSISVTFLPVQSVYI